MKGIEFVIDDTGRRKAVLIDLEHYGEEWEDFYDALIARKREGEPRESLEEVRKRLQEAIE